MTTHPLKNHYSPIPTILTIITSIFLVAVACIEKNISIPVFYAALLFAFAVVSPKISKAEKEIFITTVSISILFSIVIYYLYLDRYGLPHYLPGQDDYSYEIDAEHTAKTTSILEYKPSSITHQIQLHNSPGYIYILSLIQRIGYFFDTPNALLAKIFNCFLLGVISITSFTTLQKLGFNDKTSKSASLTAALFPIMLFVSAHSYRDILASTILLISLTISLETYRSQNKSKTILLTAISILLFISLFEIRKAQTIPLAAMQITAIYIKTFPRLSNLKLIALGLISIIAAAFISLASGIFPSLLMESAQLLSNYQSGMVEQAQGHSSLVFNQPFPINIFTRLAYSAITPIPMLYALPEWNLIAAGTIIQMLFYPFIFLGLWKSLSDKETLPIGVGFILIFFGYFMGTFSFRHLTQVVPFAVILAAIGYHHYYKLRAGLLAISFFLIFSYCTINIGLMLT